jgi:hypothetical protein
MAVQYTVQISDADYRALCFVTDNPNQYVDDHVTVAITQMKDQLIEHLIKTELEKPGTRSIPADREGLLAQANVKTALEIEKADTDRMLKLVENPDAFEEDIGEAAILPDTLI